MDNSNLFICIDHVGVAVPNLDEAIKLHTEVLGFRILHREVNQEQGIEEVMLGTGDQLPQSTQVQLLYPVNPEATVAKWMEKNNGKGGIHHLCYRVADIDQVSAALQAQGMRLLYDAPKIGTGGNRINFVHPKSTGGILLELTEQAGSH